MREIKFRYRYTDGKDWLFSVFTLAEICNGEPFEFLSDNPLLKRFKHVGQDEFTGMRDKAGKDIFESDISRYSSDGYKFENGDVIFSDGCFRVRCTLLHTLSRAVTQLFEVIGNKYEHPHLLT